MATRTNRQTVRIRWGDCDPAGIIFYPRYFGITKHEMFKTYEFAGWPLMQTQARFMKPNASAMT
jgi:4-hydroxybenzoyl-CoA thioesterase